ncbi:MAG: hypothetical protein ACREGJ_01130 [Candidatus Saccharimonadales bacterium]
MGFLRKLFALDQQIKILESPAAKNPKAAKKEADRLRAKRDRLKKQHDKNG